MTVSAAGCASPAPRGWIGLNTQAGWWEPALGERVGAAGPADRRIDFDLVRELGVPMVRDLAMNWGRIQPQAGAAFDFSVSDEIVAQAQSADADLLILCWGVPRWAAPAPGDQPVDPGVPAREHAGAFAAFVKAFVERYDRDGVADMPGLRRPVAAYEFMNDVESVPPAEYAFWLKLFRAAVKQADARARVVCGSLRSPGVRLVQRPDGDYPTWMERLLAEPGLQGAGFPHFDVAAFVCYPAEYPGRAPFEDGLAYVSQTLAAAGLRLPVWVTAFGFDSGSKNEPQQADNLFKWAIHGRALGIDRLYVDGLRDYRLAGDTGVGRNTGLVREASPGAVPARKPAFQALAMLIREIAERPQVARYRDGLYALTGAGEIRYVLWKVESYDAREFLIPDWWEVTRLSGSRAVRQGSAIRPGSSPVLLKRVRSPFIR